MKRCARLAGTLVVLAVVILVPMLGWAAEVQTYSKQAFIAAQDSGRPIVVFVTASWCPNCRKQQPVVDSISKDASFADAFVFVIDYDADKQALRDFDVRMQSTLIAFKGKAERMRSSAVTHPDAIRKLFQSAL